MAGLMDSLSTVNSFLRTVMAVVVLGVVSAGSWLGYQTYYARDLEIEKKSRELESTRLNLESARKDLDQAQAQIVAQREELVLKQQQIEKLDAALRLLKVNHRVARLTVRDQSRDADGSVQTSTVEFVEVDDQGKAIDEPKVFQIAGDVVYLDNWVVKFDDKYVEQADIDRSTSLVLFRRIFGEQQQPREGFPLDPTGKAPRAYARGGLISEFERRIWEDFWTIANDEARARELGIRAAHGEAVSIKVLPGKSYKIQLRASDGLSITPDDQAPPPPATRPAA